MSENPFQPPPAEAAAVGVKSGRRADLLSVAKHQKGILVCILVQLILFPCLAAMPIQLKILFLPILLGVGIAGTVFVFLLAVKVYSPAVGVLFGLLTLVPCVGLIALLLVNGKATDILRQNGLKVGLMGAKLAEIKTDES